MLSFPKIALAAAVAMTLSAAQARAEDQPAPAGEKPAAQASGETSPSDIAKLVTQLDAERFTDRQAASEKLEALGKTAIPELSKAATGESLEASVRAIALLGKFYESSDAATKAAAKTALEAIAKGDNAPAAARAKEALKAEEDEQNPQQAQQGQIIIGNAKGFQLGGPGGFSSKSIQTVNGVKKIDVSAADGKKIKISDGKKEGIKIEVTKKNKEGKEETEKYEAKDVDELKTKFPEGYKIYKEHAEDGAMGMLGGMVRAERAEDSGRRRRHAGDSPPARPASRHPRRPGQDHPRTGATPRRQRHRSRRPVGRTVGRTPRRSGQRRRTEECLQRRQGRPEEATRRPQAADRRDGKAARRKDREAGGREGREVRA